MLALVAITHALFFLFPLRATIASGRAKADPRDKREDDDGEAGREEDSYRRASKNRFSSAAASASAMPP
jgi:uncharacterized MAPEG superfamily protein